MYQGSTFDEVIRWESPNKVYKPITSITKAAPTVITAPAHGLIPGLRTKVTNVLGMKEINSTDSYLLVTDSTTDTITIGDLNSLGYTAYTSGGTLEYNAPVDLTGYTARLQVREKLTSDIVLLELSTSNGGIVLNNTNKTIRLVYSATNTALLTFTSGVYSLEMENSGVVTTIMSGTISLVKEITRN